MRPAEQLRPDVTVVSATDDVVVLRDPRTNRYFRLGQVEYRALADPDESTLAIAASVRARARSAGLLDETVKPSPRVIRLSWWYSRINLGDPSGLLAWQRSVVGTTGLIAIAALLTAGAGVAVVATLASGGASLSAAGVSPSVATALEAFVGLLACLLLHEWAHASVLSVFGRTSHRLGFVFLFVLPIGFCDATEGLLLTSRWRRALIPLAGPWMNAVLFAGFWWSGTAFHLEVALRIAQGNAVAVAFNLLPIVRLDGYRLLEFAWGKKATAPIDWTLAQAGQVMRQLSAVVAGMSGRPVA